MRIITTLLLLSLAPIAARSDVMPQPTGSQPGAPPQPAGQQPAGQQPPGASTTAIVESPSSPQFSRFGVQFDVGVPDGFGLMLLYKPLWWMRLNGGMAYNILGFGIRGGVTVMPVRWKVTPTFNLDFGHYFSGDLNKFVNASNTYEKALLSQAAYNFISGQVGLEFGSQDGFVFYLRGGLTYLSAGLAGKDLTDYANSTYGAGSSEHYSFGDANFTGIIPSVSLGFTLSLFK